MLIDPRPKGPIDWQRLKSMSHKKLCFFPVGGVGRFGMNQFVIIHEAKYYLVDCGANFADDFLLGIERLVPRLPPEFFDAFGLPCAYLITHGHDDHIGGLPSVLPFLPAPVYATWWTAELIRKKFRADFRGLDPLLRIVDPFSDQFIDDLKFRWLSIDHSIPSACMLYVRTPRDRLLFTGDFRFGDAARLIDFEKSVEIDSHGPLDVLFCDSTNADKAGMCPDENLALSGLSEALTNASGCTYVTTFSSNFQRIGGLIRVCADRGKRVHICGRGLLETVELGTLSGWTPPSGCLVRESDLGEVDRSNLVVLITGCQADHNSALRRLAERAFRGLTLVPGDTVIFSARFIPGNEKNLYSLIADLEWQGVRVITPKAMPDIHSSGHAYQEDIAQLLSRCSTRRFIPIHGSFSHLLSSARNIGPRFPEMPCSLIQNGQVYALDKDRVEVLGEFERLLHYIDDESNGILTYDSMRQRMRIGEKGLALINGVYHVAQGVWLSPLLLEFVGLGFAPLFDKEKFKKDLGARLVELGESLCKSGSNLPAVEINSELRLFARRTCLKQLGKKPEVYSRVHFLDL